MENEGRDAMQTRETKDGEDDNAVAVAESSSHKLEDRAPQLATVNGSYSFSLTGYSLAKGMDSGKYISSGNFNVGGHEWAVYFYPGGKYAGDEYQAYVSVYIALVSDSSDVQAIFEMKLMDQSGSGNHLVHSHFNRELDRPFTLKDKGSMWGYKRFFNRSMLQQSEFLRNDTLEITGRVGVLLSSVKLTKLNTSPRSALSLAEHHRSGTEDDSSPQSSTPDSIKSAGSQSGSASTSAFEVRRLEDEVARYYHKLVGNRSSSSNSVDERSQPQNVPSVN